MKTLLAILLAIVLIVTLSQVDLTAQAGGGHQYQLKLSLIECRGTYVRIEFRLYGTKSWDTISSLTYTYGTISSGTRSGNVVYFRDDVSPGYYNITSAQVKVNTSWV